MDIEISAGEVTVTSLKRSYMKALTLKIEDIDKSDLNNIEVAKCIDIDIYIEAIGEDELKRHIEQYYDWFK